MLRPWDIGQHYLQFCGAGGKWKSEHKTSNACKINLKKKPFKNHKYIRIGFIKKCIETHERKLKKYEKKLKNAKKGKKRGNIHGLRNSHQCSPCICKVSLWSQRHITKFVYMVYRVWWVDLMWIWIKGTNSQDKLEDL